MEQLYNTDLESSLLCTFLLHPTIIPEARALGVTLDTFYRQTNKAIFKAMLRLQEAGESIDLHNLTDFFHRHDYLKKIGGVGTLTSMASQEPTWANWKSYAHNLIFYAMKRSALDSIKKLEGAVYESGEMDDFKRYVSDTQEELSRALLSGVEDTDTPEEDLDEFEEWQIMRASGEDNSLVTGLKNVDNRYGRMEAGQLIIVAGRPSMGKSAYALQCVVNQAMAGKRIALFSVEMTKHEMYARILANVSGLDLAKIFDVRLMSQEDCERYEAAKAEVRKWRVKMGCEKFNTPSKILARAREIEAKMGLDIVYIDHVHRMDADGGWKANENGNAKYTSISNDLKHVAMTLNVPVVAVAQLNRSVESRTDKTPQLSDLRDSGSIEQDADVVQLLYRPSYYENSDEQGSDVIGDETQLIIAKNRNGKTGIAALRFIPQVQRFIDSDFVATHEKVEVPE